jgi:hypothetical protein
MLIGYARVSKPDQNPELQLDALQDAKCDKIYVDYLTGAKTDRPEWQELLAYIREGGSRKKRVRRISGMRVDLMPGIRPYTVPRVIALSFLLIYVDERLESGFTIGLIGVHGAWATSYLVVIAGSL